MPVILLPKSAVVFVPPELDPEPELELEDETIAPFVGLVGIVIPASIAPVRVRVPVPILSIEPEAEELATLKGCVLVTPAERLYLYRAPVLWNVKLALSKFNLPDVPPVPITMSPP